MKPYLNTLLIAAAIILTALIVSNAFINRNSSNNTINVTGGGRKDFVSDLIVWSGSFTRKNMVLKDAYTALDQDRELIREYLIGKGVKPELIIFKAVEIQKQYDESFDNTGRRVNAVFTGYQLRQDVQIESKQVNKIEEISRQITELINAGVEFYSNPPEYYYTNLAELKIEMIAQATKDANLRAQRIAENAGGKVGSLKKADMGVFQIVAQNSSEEYSWGGSFNTSSKNKTANVTITLEYEVR